jgi:hypothetical protein
VAGVRLTVRTAGRARLSSSHITKKPRPEAAVFMPHFRQENYGLTRTMVGSGMLAAPP